jgi:ribosomal protein S8
MGSRVTHKEENTMMNIKLATDNRKAVAARLAEITGAEARYTRVPRCAYEVGAYIIEKDGTITTSEDADLQPLKILADEGFIENFEAPAEESTTESEPEAIGLTVEIQQWISTTQLTYHIVIFSISYQVQHISQFIETQSLVLAIGFYDGYLLHDAYVYDSDYKSTKYNMNCQKKYSISNVTMSLL